MRKTLYVHLGMPKAGSTALQNFLYMNRELLEKTGLLYPDPRALEQFSCNPQRMTGHHIVPMYMTGFFWATFPKKEGVEAADVFRFIKQQIAASVAPKILLSSEACWFMLNRQDVVHEFADAFSDFNLKVIAYLRRQDDHIQSGYNECVKSSFYTMTIDEFIEDRFLDPSNHYYTHLMHWVNAIGHENVKARLYDKNCLINGSIFEDLLAQCGYDWVQGAVLPEKDANPRMSLNALMFQRCINLLSPEKEMSLGFSQVLLSFSAIEDATTEKAFAGQNLLSQKQKELINNFYRTENQKVSAGFLSTPEQAIFPDEDRNSETPYPGLTQKKITDIIDFIKSVSPECFEFLKSKAMAEKNLNIEVPEEPLNLLLKSIKSYLLIDIKS